MTASGEKTAIAGTAGQSGIRLGAPAGSALYGVRKISVSAADPTEVPLAPTGVNTYVLVSGAAILQLAVPVNSPGRAALG